MDDSNLSTSKVIKEEHSGFLIEFIKEDRNEIRIIKNRIYTYMQALLVASFAVTAFLIKDGKESWPIGPMIIGVNVVFLLLSWSIFLLLNEDLYFVRQCLNKRQKKLTEICADFFQLPKKKGSKKKSSKKENYLPPWLSLFIKHYEFENDGLLFLLMIVLTLIYIVIIGVTLHFL